MKIKLEQETGQTLLSRYGNVLALAFKGDADFIKRSYNFAYNFGATNGALIELTQDMSYVLTSHEKLMKALKLYFYADVIMNREIEVNFDDEDNVLIDEEACERLSGEKAQSFFENGIIKENFMFNKYLTRIEKDKNF